MDIAKLKSINAKILLVKSNIEHKKNEILMTEAQIKNLNDRLLLQNETLKKLVMKEIIKDEPRVPVDNWDLNYHLKSLTSVVEALPFGAPQFLIQNGSPIEDNSCNIFLNSDIEFGNLLQEDFRQWMGSISLPQTTPRDLIVEECSKEKKARLARERKKRWTEKQSEEALAIIRFKDRERKRLKRLSASEEELMKRRLANNVSRSIRRKKALETGEIYAIRAKEAERQRQCQLTKAEERTCRQRPSDVKRWSTVRKDDAKISSIDGSGSNEVTEKRQYGSFEKEPQIQSWSVEDVKTHSLLNDIMIASTEVSGKLQENNTKDITKTLIKGLCEPIDIIMTDDACHSKRSFKKKLSTIVNNEVDDFQLLSEPPRFS